MNTEIWKDIKGFEGYYQISSKGNVRSLDRWGKGFKKFYKGNIISQCKRPTGYMMVSLSKNGNARTFNVHRLVAEAFLPNPENKPCIDHINTIRDDNRVWVNEDGSIDYDKSNLRWVTHKENVNNPKTQIHMKIQQENKKIKTLQNKLMAFCSYA